MSAERKIYTAIITFLIVLLAVVCAIFTDEINKLSTPKDTYKNYQIIIYNDAGGVVKIYSGVYAVAINGSTVTIKERDGATYTYANALTEIVCSPPSNSN